MWEKGNIIINGVKVNYTIKHFDKPSEDYGIEEGRISKMELRVNKKIVMNYDRGWDVEPTDEVSQLAYMALLKKYN